MTLAEQLEAAVKKNEESDKTILDLIAKVEAAQGKITIAEEAAKTLQAQLDAGATDKTAIEAKLTAAVEATATLQKEFDTTKADLTKATNQLELSPGHAQLTPGNAKPIAAGDVETSEEGGELWAQYNVLKKSDPEAATLFYRENKKALQAETAMILAKEKDND